MLSGEIVYSTRLLIQYMKALTKSEKLKAFIAPKMTDLITFIDKNGKSADCDGGDIHGIYSYLELLHQCCWMTKSQNDENDDLKLSMWLELQLSIDNGRYHEYLLPYR